MGAKMPPARRRDRGRKCEPFIRLQRSENEKTASAREGRCPLADRLVSGERPTPARREA